MQRILLIDDEPANLKLLSEILSKQGFDIMVVRTEESGLEMAASMYPELILLNIKSRS